MAETNTPTNTASTSNNYEDKDRINTKPPMFDGENFDYWKDRIESFSWVMTQICGIWWLMATLILLTVKVKRFKESL